LKARGYVIAIRRMGGNPQPCVTKHASARWAERVRPCSRQEAVADILSHSKAIAIAADFGASTIRLGSGHRLRLEGATVVTVTPPSGRF